MEIKQEDLVEIGRNVMGVIQGDNLILVVNLKGKTQPSKSSGKMNILASTDGWTGLPQGWRGYIMVGKKA